MPRLGGDAGLTPERVEELLEAGDPIGGKLEGLLDGVHQPTQDNFPGAEVRISLEQFLKGRNVLAGAGVVRIQGLKDSVNGMEELAEMYQPGLLVTLHGEEKIIDVDVKAAHRAVEGAKHRVLEFCYKQC